VTVLLHGQSTGWNHDGFVALVQETGGAVPKNADQILRLRLLLEGVVAEPYPCLISTYVGTGRSEKNTGFAETGTQTAEEACGTDGWVFDTTVQDAYDAAAKVLPPDDYAVLVSWGDQKAVKALADVKRNVDEDLSKLKWSLGGGFGLLALGVAALWLLGQRAKR